MADSAGGKLQVVVVTPERAVLDEHAESVTLPMFDGELGVRPGRAALIGRLGAGELRFTNGTVTKRFFVDAGFAQVRADVVTVLTAKAIPAAEVTADAAAAAATAASALPARTTIEREHRETAQERARGMARVAAKA
jgi:F-type H+-transporting ATPase subunit epsilon